MAASADRVGLSDPSPSRADSLGPSGPYSKRSPRIDGVHTPLRHRERAPQWAGKEKHNECFCRDNTKRALQHPRIRLNRALTHIEKCACRWRYAFSCFGVRPTAASPASAPRSPPLHFLRACAPQPFAHCLAVILCLVLNLVRRAAWTALARCPPPRAPALRLLRRPHGRPLPALSH